MSNVIDFYAAVTRRMETNNPIQYISQKELEEAQRWLAEQPLTCPCCGQDIPDDWLPVA